MTRAWRKPAALRPGNCVGVCAPAGPVDRERLLRGIGALEQLGFTVKWDEGLLARAGISAGSTQRRLQELHGLFSDDEVAGIVCARGGAGVIHLLPELDARLIEAHPKALIGYSDITLLHLALQQLGISSLHGPMVARGLCDGSFDAADLLGALAGDPAEFDGADGLLVLGQGVAEGTLQGGCLSLLAAAAGTAWGLRFQEPTILFLEDVAEPPYRLDRMVRQLRLAGALQSVVGIVFGEMLGCRPAPEETYTLEDVLLAALDGYPGPIAIGLPSGHVSGTCYTLPLGVPARLSCVGEARLSCPEGAVA